MIRILFCKLIESMWSSCGGVKVHKYAVIPFVYQIYSPHQFNKG